MMAKFESCPSACLLDILEAFLRASVEGVELGGYALAVRSRRRFGEVYYRGLGPLEAAGWIIPRWERVPGRDDRRRVYQLSLDGVTKARELLATHRPPGSPPSLRHRILNLWDAVKSRVKPGRRSV